MRQDGLETEHEAIVIVALSSPALVLRCLFSLGMEQSVSSHINHYILRIRFRYWSTTLRLGSG